VEIRATAAVLRHACAVAGHFQAIGVEDWRAFCDHAFDHGEWSHRPDDGETVVYRDKSGASIVVWTNAANEVVDVAPSFVAESRILAGDVGTYENPEHLFSSVVSVEVLDQGEMLYPLVTQLENVQDMLGARRARPGRASLR
jgi:hypothetical protein